MTGAIRRYMAENRAKFDPREYLKPAMAAAKKVCKERYQQFGPENTITAYTAALILALIAVLALVVVTSLRPKENPQ
jgi:hypothetical protein